MSRRTTLQMVLRLTALLGIGWAGTHTLIGHQASLAAEFTEGTVDINASRFSTAFSASNLTPSDDRYRELAVSNDRSLDLRYTLTTHATNPDGKDLAGQLYAEARKVSGTCDAASFPASTDRIAPASKPCRLLPSVDAHKPGKRLSGRHGGGDVQDRRDPGRGQLLIRGTVR